MAADRHNCARLENGDIKCWGINDFGGLGLGDTHRRGNDPNEMGDLFAGCQLRQLILAAEPVASHYREVGTL
ncbi:MAG TPA: RCC1 domain-containing protein [Labilithrix sp.]|nr:RCC1 domain-containing protein [Labilithrix sp.]